MKHIFFIDTEVSEADKKAHDFGAVNENDDKLHTRSANEFHSFIEGAEYLCGHNIINHDAKYIDITDTVKRIDTLYLSPLLFPNKPYHKLLKDDKLQTDELNNPLNDAIKAKELFYDEVNTFLSLDDAMKLIYYMLLNHDIYFSAFFDYLGFSANDDLETAIKVRFVDEVCENAPLSNIIANSPVELAYCLALISATEEYSLIPRWVQINYPSVNGIMRILRNTSCHQCDYCKSRLNPVTYLGKYFGYSSFRRYNDEPLQENAVTAAVDHRSLLAIFPTGGGKSLTFQIPALMAGETERALTVVISPLQSLMKDQVDNLEQRGIAEAVTINGLLSPLERAEAIDRVESGIASILYISPESLRSVTIEQLFLSRHIDRFVIDEAHCFSAWGQDFRVDYLYIGDFIRELQEKKGHGCKIPVSCFTATAKQKVISDIKDYFKEKLDIDLELFATNASRTNLRYEVLYRETDVEKYDTLRSLIEQKNCPTIVYVSRTKRTRELAEKLSNDDFKARPFNGKMDSSEKQENQEAFINDEIQIIVATSAFGMGVDKSNVKLVVHYDISDSLENYVQEAGRAGRDEKLQAECYVLFNDGDLDKHFILLNQTKLSISEIQQVWKAIKDLTRIRPEVCCSPLEVARQAGWDDSVADIETRVKTAIQALENAGYIKRGKNMPHVYADGILVKSMIEAAAKIDSSFRFENDEERTTAKRIIKSLISSKSVAKAENADAESRVDYLADKLGIEKSDVIHSIQQMREDGLLADAKDLTAYIQKTDTVNKSMLVLRRFQALESFLLEYIDADKLCMNYKELNEAALANGIKTSSVNSIKTIFYYWTIRSYIQKEQDQATNKVIIVPKMSIGRIRNKRGKSYAVAEFIINYLFQVSSEDVSPKNEVLVGFSILELLNAYRERSLIEVNEQDIEEALLFLSKIGALKLEGGFLVLYSGMRIKRLILDNKIRYKLEDYRQLNEFYQQKIQQIHIVGEYANMMVRDYNKALQFVNDYFQMDYKKFLSLYFSGERAAEIERNITPEKYRQLFDTLSDRQLAIIRDDASKYIVVSAGPGSGKTRVLVHKLASLLLLEDVKHEQLLMLTFSRAAVIEFKQRLRDLIGNAANFIEIKTFHSYCFDLLGKIGNLQDTENIVKDAGELIRNGDVDPSRITKSVLVIDEAQDMDIHEYRLVEALMERNEDMRIIAVGDDDQNIYQFRGSDSKYLRSLITEHEAKQYSLIDNYRSCLSVVAFANQFVKSISDRMKTEDIAAVTENSGEVKLIKHSVANMETALVEDIISVNAIGSTCILTNTNQEALLILGILKQRNIPAKLIQSIDGFDLYDIAEMRYFLKTLNKNNTSPVISNDQWDHAVHALQEQYSNSACMPVIISILRTFADSNEKKYRTDFEMFLHESKMEDFHTNEQGIITISTMHKSKGREFDNVYILLRNSCLSGEEERRKLYVGMTRAKQLLHIHYFGDALDQYAEYATIHEIDLHTYPKPSELILQLSHRDIFLDFFKDKKSLILKLKSGMHLAVKGNRLYVQVNGRLTPVLQFSTKCNETIKQLIASGYTPYDALIRFICAWKGKEDTSESAVILADITFRRNT
ncbi:MAG: RecQ family ATP-dependent DNA helicase [Oscillospiraceae bacterium]